MAITENITKLEFGKEYKIESKDENNFVISKDNISNSKNLVIGIAHKDFMFPKGRFSINGKEEDLLGWYNEVRIDNDDDIVSFSVETSAKVLKINTWSEEKDDCNIENFIVKNESDPKYDRWIHWNLGERCNLRCQYCDNIQREFAEIIPIQIPRLIESLDFTEKIYKITFVGGGEPFLVPNIIEACKELTKKHYVGFVTNLTSTKIKEMAETLSPDRVEYILASFHIKALEEKKLIDRYIENYLFCKEKGFSIHAQTVAFPTLLDECRMYRDIFSKKGLDIVFTPFIGEFEGKQYPQAYTDEEMNEFGFTNEDKEVHNSLGVTCNAGYNVAMVMPRGDTLNCTVSKKWIGNIYHYIDFNKNMTKCPNKYCRCPVYLHDQPLFYKGQNELKNE